MKKSNVILAVVLAAVSVFLLWLWFYLGFNLVDNPVDLTVSIAWWIVLVAVAALIARAEKKRQQAVRTVFLGKGKAFNPELGVVELGGESVATDVEGIIERLEYGFKKHDLSEDAAELYSTVIKSPVFKVRKGNDSSETRQVDWEGEVIFTVTGETTSFSSKEELGKILSR